MDKSEYYREYMKVYAKKRIVCECGKEISRGRLYEHRKTSYHQLNVLKSQLSSLTKI